MTGMKTSIGAAEASLRYVRRRQIYRFCRLTLVIAVVGLSGCVTPDSPFKSGGYGGGGNDSFISEPLILASKGIEIIDDGDYDKASAVFNLALKLDTTNSYLQFLNGLAYHLRALKGDASLYPMAQQGYELALKFDQGNWLAHYHLGMLHMEQKNYAVAREYLAEAALYNAEDPDILYNLAVASYYARDLKTAAGILERLQEITPGGVQELRAASLVMAALGDDNKATDYFSRFKKVSGNSHQVNYLTRRLNDWRQFHKRADTPRAQTVSSQLAEAPEMQAYPKPMVEVASPLDRDADQAPLPSPFSKKRDDETEEVPSYDPLAAGEDGETVDESPIDEHRMVIVDVVIIRTEENLTTSKGVNLLNGLTLQFGTTDASNSGFSFKQSSSKTTANLTSTITKAINIKSINYSLNIANSNTTRNEILARPTLVAMAGEQSDFFSGVEVDAAAVGGSNSDGATVSVQKEIGVKLSLTPEFLEDGRIKLNVTAERTFLTTPNTTSVTFTLRVDTSKTNVNANVAMNFGETLILSGLSEKETERTRDGVPLLQDVPGLQYLFSKATTRDFQKSVLILITPRLPNYIYRPDRAREKAEQSMTDSERALNEFQARYSDWFRPYPNWASVFHHMQDNQLYREFRTGDVSLERWASQSTLRERLNQAKEFLFY